MYYVAQIVYPLYPGLPIRPWQKEALCVEAQFSGSQRRYWLEWTRPYSTTTSSPLQCPVFYQPQVPFCSLTASLARSSISFDNASALDTSHWLGERAGGNRVSMSANRRMAKTRTGCLQCKQRKIKVRE